MRNFESITKDALKNSFGKLRMNGKLLKPFVVSLSNHEFTKPLKYFMVMLLAAFVAGCGNGNLADSPALVSVAVTPATASIPLAVTQQFVATATYSDGSSRIVTSSASWTSANTSVATVNSTTGLATGVSTGSTVITATFGGQSATAALTVTAATLQSIAVTPATASVAMGLSPGNLRRQRPIAI